ncbi:MAG: EF-hand domain-containing protein [Pseudomonadota bacterium]
MFANTPLLGAALMLFVASVADAQTTGAGAESAAGPMPGDVLFARVDTDADGAISRAEAVAARRTLFERIDLDGDGRVTEEEIERLRDRIYDMARLADAMLGLRARRIDSDGDGAVSVEEFTGRMTLFELVDRNEDGMVSRDEMVRARAIAGVR